MKANDTPRLTARVQCSGMHSGLQWRRYLQWHHKEPQVVLEECVHRMHDGGVVMVEAPRREGDEDQGVEVDTEVYKSTNTTNSRRTDTADVGKTLGLHHKTPLA